MSQGEGKLSLKDEDGEAKGLQGTGAQLVAGPRLVHFTPPTGCQSPFPFYRKTPSGSVTWS